MKVLRQPEDLPPDGRPICAAIGVFDGLHLGHQQVLRHARQQADLCQGRAVAITFDRHPQSLLAPPLAPLAICPLAQKIRLLAAAGLDAAWVIPFDLPFSQTPAESFVRRLASAFTPLQSVTVGDSFVFGHRRSGNLALLQSLGHQLGFHAHGLPPVQFDREIVSSTRVREAIAAGHLHLAAQLLGRPYSLSGTVIRGRQLGRQLGFPTANLTPRGLVLPPNGVYAARAFLDDHAHPAVLNLGHRPTVTDGPATLHCEVHLLDFQGDLYDRELAVEFVARLRGEQRFPDLPALQAQIARDLQSARTLLAAMPEPPPPPWNLTQND